MVAQKRARSSLKPAQRLCGRSGTPNSSPSGRVQLSRPISPGRALPAAPRAAPYSPARPNSHFKTLKRELRGRRRLNRRFRARSVAGLRHHGAATSVHIEASHRGALPPRLPVCRDSATSRRRSSDGVATRRRLLSMRSARRPFSRCRSGSRRSVLPTSRAISSA